jgi:propanol-preferring alcohol dehydrogenase
MALAILMNDGPILIERQLRRVAFVTEGGVGQIEAQLIAHAAHASGADKAEFARKLGAHHYIDSSSVDPGLALQKLGGAALVIVTASGGKAAAQTMKGLRPRGRIIALGATPDPEVSTTDLLFGNRSIKGAITGDPATGDTTLRFSVLTGVAAMSRPCRSKKLRKLMLR